MAVPSAAKAAGVAVAAEAVEATAAGRRAAAVLAVRNRVFYADKRRGAQAGSLLLDF